MVGVTDELIMKKLPFGFIQALEDDEHGRFIKGEKFEYVEREDNLVFIKSNSSWVSLDKFKLINSG